MLNLSQAYNVSRVLNVNFLVCSTIDRRALCFTDDCEGLLFLVVDGMLIKSLKEIMVLKGNE